MMKKYFVLKGDRLLWAMIILLILFSLVVVFSSTGKLGYEKYHGDLNHPFQQHLISFILGAMIMLVAQSVHYKYFISLGPLVWLIALAGILLAVFGPETMRINEAQRSLRVPILGSIQPAEIAKLGVVMWVARIIALDQEDGHCGWGAVIKVGICALPAAALIFKENFSTSVILAAVVLAMLFVGRLRGKIMTIVLVASLALSLSFLWVIYNKPELIEDVARVSTVKSRLAGTNDYQLRQSKIAIASGGLRGVGPGRSVQRDFLPNPFSDCVYSIIIEEYGLIIGGGGVLLVYLIILYRVGHIIRRCTRMFPALLVAGLGLMIVFQALVHMLVCVGIFPMTGQQLPFLSKGGTSVLATACAFGMIQSVAYTFSEAGRREEEERLERRRRKIERDAEEGTRVEIS